MNCANHPQNAVSAYCRTCGKPLCTTCTRPVMGVIYCEQCLAERVGAVPAGNPYQQSSSYQPGSAPPTNSYQQAGYQPGAVPPPVSSGPNPALAGVLGAIPFGVGAIYNNQYTKGLVHLAIFVFLVVALSSGNLPGYLYPVLGIFMGFFVVYQIIDAVRTAKAIQAHEPPPDPFGLTNMFGTGAHREPASAQLSSYRNVPTGAVVLIGLGILFLLHNLNIWFLRADILWPVVLIGLGVWLLIRQQTCAPRAGCRRGSVVGPAVLITIGGLSLLDNLHGPGWDRTWPLILLVIGGVKLLERSGHLPGPPSPLPETFPPAGASVAQPPSEVNSEVKNG